MTSQQAAWLVASKLEGVLLQQNYQVDQKINKGGMAWLYKGRHLKLGGHVAIKILFEHFAETPEVKARFHREAQIQFQLNHPNIVRVIDLIEEGELLGIVMEWMEGGDLASRLIDYGGTLSPALQRHLFLPILRAISNAHSRKIIHRDLKPQNILLSDHQEPWSPKITDFGIAKILREDGLTNTGNVIGTPHYMAPEQFLNSKQIDHRADIYSLGVILYQMATGRLPFNDPDSLLFKVISEPAPPPHEAVPSLQPLLLKCLAKNPDDRFSSCEELEDAFLKATQGWPSLAEAPEILHRNKIGLASTDPLGQEVKSLLSSALDDTASIEAKQRVLSTPSSRLPTAGPPILSPPSRPSLENLPSAHRNRLPTAAEMRPFAQTPPPPSYPSGAAAAWNPSPSQPSLSPPPASPWNPSPSQIALAPTSSPTNAPAFYEDRLSRLSPVPLKTSTLTTVNPVYLAPVSPLRTSPSLFVVFFFLLSSLVAFLQPWEIYPPEPDTTHPSALRKASFSSPHSHSHPSPPSNPSRLSPAPPTRLGTPSTPIPPANPSLPPSSRASSLPPAPSDPFVLPSELLSW